MNFNFLNMKKIPLKVALAQIETLYVADTLQEFSLSFVKCGKDIGVLEHCQKCWRVNPSEQRHDFKEIAKKTGTNSLNKNTYNAFEKRVVRFFCAKRNHYIAVKVDLITHFNNLEIDHEKE